VIDPPYAEPGDSKTCWWCGVEPTEVVEQTFDITVMEQVEPVQQIKHSWVRWPQGDHEHAELPPSPAQLEQAGHEVLARILQDV
jgi:hypothetical protein